MQKRFTQSERRLTLLTSNAFRSLLILCCLGQATLFGQDQKTKSTAPPNDPLALPKCSTERVNDNCSINIDRTYPITMPTIKMNRGAYITVWVYHHLQYEHLTLDPGPASAYEGTDQAAGLLNAVIPVAKGTSIDTTTQFDTQIAAPEAFAMATAGLPPPPPPPAGQIQTMSQAKQAEMKQKQRELAQELSMELQKLDADLTKSRKTLDPINSYLADTAAIYARIAEVASATPHALNTNGEPIRTVSDSNTPIPWKDYRGWVRYMRAKLLEQGIKTTAMWDLLQIACQNSGIAPTPIPNPPPNTPVMPTAPPKDPPPQLGPWLPPARACVLPNTKTQPSSTAPAIDPDYDADYAAFATHFALLNRNEPNPETFAWLSNEKARIEKRHERLDALLKSIQVTLPTQLTKYSTDMEMYLSIIGLPSETTKTEDLTDSTTPVLVGVIPGPADRELRKALSDVNHPLTLSDDQKRVAKAVRLYKALAPTITYTVNGQNQIINSLLQGPAASLKQPIITISVVYASPRFEESTGVFISFLPSHTFTNSTNATVTGQTPSESSISIISTTTKPLIIPYVAANYRFSGEQTWGLDGDGRRRAWYATLGLGVNPYNTQLEYIGGLSVSWRYLIFSGLYHLGHASHLIDGERVGQVWCSNAASTSGSSTLPSCSPAPPSPATKNYLTGAFAIGIGIRIPTLFNAANP